VSKTPITDAQCVIVDSKAQRALCEDWLEAVDAAFARRLEESHSRLVEALESIFRSSGSPLAHAALLAAKEIK
jgi:hypothetical protein